MRRWMQFGLVGALAMVGAGQTSVPPTGPGPLTAKATVLRMASSVALDQHDVAQWFPDQVASFRNSGTATMTLLVEFSAPVGSVRDEIAITAITDEHGNMLVGASAAFSRTDSFPDQPSVLSKDKKAVMVDVTMKETPNASARQLTIKGRLSIAQEGQTRILQADKAPLEIGQEFKAGEVTLRVVRLAMVDGGNVAIGLRSSSDAIKTIEFVDAGGKVLAQTRDPQDERDSRFQRDMSGTAGEQVMNYVVGPGVGDTVSLRVTFAQEAKSIDVPFEAVAGIGL